MKENCVEVEAKYLVKADQGWLEMQVLMFFLENGLVPEHIGTLGSDITLVDSYYDTLDRFLLKNDLSLRIRQKSGRSFITCKKPYEQNPEQGRQLERYEWETETETREITDGKNAEFIKTCFVDFVTDGLLDINDLRKTVTIKNNRRLLLHGIAAAHYEVAFDDATYLNEITGKTFSERQLEIEKRSDETSVEEMQMMIDKFEAFLGDRIERCIESKYDRASRFTS